MEMHPDIKAMSEQDALTIITKPSGSKNRFLSYDNTSNIAVVEVKSAPEKGKANLDILSLIRKELKKDARIIRGKTSKRKLVRLHPLS